MRRKILFPVDFSPPCLAMAAYVQRAAKLFGAEVTLLHATRNLCRSSRRAWALRIFKPLQVPMHRFALQSDQ